MSKKHMGILIVSLIVLPILLGVVAFNIHIVYSNPKSLYLIANHHTAQFDAWGIQPDGTTIYQATYNLQHATDPSGIAIDESSNTLFVTSEFSLAGVELVDATTMTFIGTAPGPIDLAGIDVDDADDVVYAVHRETNDLYVYNWHPNNNTLTPQAGFNPFDLPNCSSAFGIALDERTGILWIADSGDGIARAYNVESWNETESMSFTPSHKPVDIAVDRQRGFVYTVSMSLGASVPPGCGSNNLSRYEVATGIETTVDMGIRALVLQ